MTIIYISLPFFADCDFPLIKELRQQGCRIIHIIPITPQCLKSTLINIHTQNPHDGIFSATMYKEIAIYSDYINQDTYVINRPYKSQHIIKKLKSGFLLFQFIKSFHPDYVWTSTPFGITDFILYFFKSNVLTVHDPFPHTGENSIRKTILEKIAFTRFKKIILLNKTQSNAFMKAYNIKPSTLLTNRLGSYDCINIFASKSESTQSYYPYVLFYGRISPYKGTKYLLESFVSLHKKAPKLRLIIAGSGKFDFDISMYKNLDYIEIRNYYIGMEETASLFKNALFIVCPYIDATQSGVIMTAYTMNKAVIATNVGALPEYVMNNETGLIVEPNNTKQLHDSILFLYEHPETLKRFEKNIQHHYKEGEYSWQNIAKKYISFFKMPHRDISDKDQNQTES